MEIYNRPGKKISPHQAQIDALMADPALSENHYNMLKSAKKDLKELEEASSASSSGTEDDAHVRIFRL